MGKHKAGKHTEDAARKRAQEKADEFEAQRARRKERDDRLQREAENARMDVLPPRQDDA